MTKEDGRGRDAQEVFSGPYSVRTPQIEHEVDLSHVKGTLIRIIGSPFSTPEEKMRARSKLEEMGVFKREGEGVGRTPRQASKSVFIYKGVSK